MKYENGKLTLDENISKDAVAQFSETACEIEIGENVTSVETVMFSRWPKLLKVTILSKDINWGAGGNFRDCPDLQTVHIASRTIGNRCFSNCGKLNFLEAPNLVRIGEYAFSNCERLDVAGVEFRRKTGVMLRVGEILFHDNPWARTWTADYENAVNEFSRVTDWQSASSSLTRLLLIDKNGISDLGAGKVTIPGVRGLGVVQQGDFCNRLAKILAISDPDIAQLSALRNEFFQKATVNSAAGRPILIFNRAICGLAADRIVPIVDIRFMESVYDWFKTHKILDEEAIGEAGSFEHWFDQGRKVHACLAKYLPQFSVFQRGVLAWAVHEDGDKKDSPERAERRARVLDNLLA